jgi:hypothetical protein
MCSDIIPPQHRRLRVLCQCGEMAWHSGVDFSCTRLKVVDEAVVIYLASAYDIRSSNNGANQRALLCTVLQRPYWSIRPWYVHEDHALTHCPLICAEFLEFDFRVVGDGRSATARYANNSNYRNDALIRKESKHRGCLPHGSKCR